MDCLICKALEEIENGTLNVIKDSDHCCVIESPFDEGDQKIVVSKQHVDYPSADLFQDALKVVGEFGPKGMIGDVPDSIGHWAARLIFLKEQGKSTSGSQGR